MLPSRVVHIAEQFIINIRNGYTICLLCVCVCVHACVYVCVPILMGPLNTVLPVCLYICHNSNKYAYHRKILCRILKQNDLIKQHAYAPKRRQGIKYTQSHVQ